MQKILLSFLLLGLLLFCFSQNRPDDTVAGQFKAYTAANKQYQQAERLSDQAGEDEALQAKADEAYQQVLSVLTNLIPAMEKAGNDSLLFFTRLKTGFINFYFDSADAAKKDYLAVISLQEKLTNVADSFLFIPCLYAGAIYYNQQQFDSAIFFYKKAEQLNDSYQKPLTESQRLYNRLGALYYENGNYRQARNYFEKAISLTGAANQSLLVNYKINIASLLVKLEEFESAKTIYQNLLPSAAFENEIYHNLGIISLKQQDFKKAVEYLRKVNYTNNKKSIELYYNFGVSYASLNEKDSSAFYLQRALAENLKWNGRRKNSQYGMLLKYQADQLTQQLYFKEAIEEYQQAIMQFHNGFNEYDSYKNPEQFSGVFSYINLFNTLTSKAAAFDNWYQQEKDIKFLNAALATYQSAFKLADYVEKTYDSDEARLFLGKIKHTVHSRPIDVSLLLYNLTKKREYLEEAYLFDQRNKASILTLTLQENELRSAADQANELILQESSIRTNITRLTLKAAQTTDSAALSHINTDIRDNEIALGKLQEKLNDDPAWQQKKAIEQIPDVNKLQEKLDNTTALLSFHLSENELLTILIMPSRFEYYKTAINKNFFAAIESFKTALHSTTADQRYTGTAVSTNLYEKLIAPLRSKLTQIKRLVIIPDDELNYLPFEALQDENKKYLIENFSIQYQYSTALLGKNEETKLPSGTLSFAPFALKGFSDSSGNYFSSLPASNSEVIKLKGKAFTDSVATKANFLQTINQYSTLHLATHASVNNERPAQSFIAFYPSTNDYKLYAKEIADLKLDSTQLVILSACETGAGKLVKGEGLMSLSRAFAYAGCPNIITSLWKAEDKTTAYLTQQLHFYLDKKYSKDKALQQAKLDLLNNKEIDPRLKSPNYWAHLLFIGDYEARHHSSDWWWIAITILVAASVYMFAKRKSLLRYFKQA